MPLSAVTWTPTHRPFPFSRAGGVILTLCPLNTAIQGPPHCRGPGAPRRACLEEGAFGHEEGLPARLRDSVCPFALTHPPRSGPLSWPHGMCVCLAHALSLPRMGGGVQGGTGALGQGQRALPCH